MELSWWEIDSWFSNVDFTIIGSGIVGLNAALRLRQKYPESKILVLERGPLPQGASTKNAGFACFGSLSEIVDDLQHHSAEEVIALIRKRWAGLKFLREMLGDEAIGFESFGGWELFPEKDDLAAACIDKLSDVNDLLRPIFNEDVFSLRNNEFAFGKIFDRLIFNPFEAQIDTGKMMQSLMRKAVAEKVLIVNSQEVQSFTETADGVLVNLPSVSFTTSKLVIANNGFAAQFTGEDVRPARAQVLITSLIPGLKVKGTFHFDRGYYYFRNVGERILFGGGRNLDFNGETTTEMGQSELIQNRLEQLLKEVILPGQKFEIEHRWSGIMGMGAKKSPVVKQLSNNVFCGVRLGGMGVAIGSLVGRELADLVSL